MNNSQSRISPCQKYQDKQNTYPPFSLQTSERRRNSQQLFQESNSILSESSAKSDPVKNKTKKRTKLETDDKRKSKVANKRRSKKKEEKTLLGEKRSSKRLKCETSVEIKRNTKFDRIIEAIRKEESLKKAKRSVKPDWRTWLNLKIDSDKQESGSDDDTLRNLSEFIFTMDCQTEKRDYYSKWMSHYDNYPKYRLHGVNFKRYLTNGRDPMLSDQVKDFKRCFVYDKHKKLSDMETKAGLIMTSWESKFYSKRIYKKRKSLDYF